jgi:transcriptional regulator with XRE-family HTH domain
MEATGNRMLELRKGFGLSQGKIAKTLHITQSAINRYEHNESAIPDSVLLKYADFFDVSLDYIFGRCEEPQGKLFDFKPDIAKMHFTNPKEWNLFIEACFDPGSQMNERLKELLLGMAGGEQK